MFQMSFCGICLLLLTIGTGKISASDQEELTFCEMISHTPNYSTFKLHNKANCLAHVKSFDKLTCLRNNDNQVRNYIFKII